MAFDIKVLLDSLHIDSAFIWGQSDGGILGFILAVKFPAKVLRLATFGANIFPGEKAVFKEIDDLVRNELRVTTDSNRRRLYSLMAYQPDITPSELRKISAPVHIMAGDRDAIKMEHSKMIFDNIPNSNLFIMPGATHFGRRRNPNFLI